jgi:hypothetical protein
LGGHSEGGCGHYCMKGLRQLRNGRMQLGTVQHIATPTQAALQMQMPREGSTLGCASSCFLREPFGEAKPSREHGIG